MNPRRRTSHHAGPGQPHGREAVEPEGDGATAIVRNPFSPNPLAPVRQALVRRLEGWLLREAVAARGGEALRSAADIALQALLEESPVPLDAEERARVVDQAVRALLDAAHQAPLDDGDGLGPLEPLMRDPAITDIMVTGPHMVFVERHGRLEEVDVRFDGAEQLVRIIQRIAQRVGRRVGGNRNMLDARLPDGSRVNAILPPLAVDGPVISIRRFAQTPLSGAALIKAGTLTPQMLEFLRCCVQARLNVLISGGTGTGKTTLLNVLSGLVPEGQRVVTIEDVAEIQIRQRHTVRLETRPPDEDGGGEVTARDLLRNALRMRPDRIVLGEVRGPEVLDMLQAMNTGHDGTMCTVHSNSPRDALHRLTTMVGMSGVNIDERVVQQMIARAIHVVVQLQRYHDGRRRIAGIGEVAGSEGNVIAMQEVFKFKQRGVDSLGHVVGEFSEMLLRPHHAERFLKAGVQPNLPGF